MLSIMPTIRNIVNPTSGPFLRPDPPPSDGNTWQAFAYLCAPLFSCGWVKPFRPDTMPEIFEISRNGCSHSISIIRMVCVMTFKQCAACGQNFRPCPQVQNHAYCAAPECQRERRRIWQQNKRRNDPIYLDNQSRSQKKWTGDNSEYWGKYRDDHPEYTERNRKQQQKRNQKKQEVQIAKMDASIQVFAFPSGRYRLVPVTSDGIAKMDAWIVEITVLS